MVRAVEKYRDGRIDYADGEASTGSTVLSERPMPGIDEINAQPEFTAEAISKAEFEEIWGPAHA